MTYEEASNGIKTWLGMMRMSNDSNEFTNEFIDCAEYMIKSDVRNSIEKQIPKKPIEICEFAENDLVGICPICNEGVNNEMRYCMECGQKLEW